MTKNDRIAPNVDTHVQVIKTAHAQISQMLRMQEDLRGLQYERGTRERINTWALLLGRDAKNAHADTIRRSLKRDLVQNLYSAAEAIMIQNRQIIVDRAAKVQRLEGVIITEQKRRMASDLVHRMKTCELDFVSKFKTTSVGSSIFWALVQLVESNYVTDDILRSEFGFANI